MTQIFTLPVKDIIVPLLYGLRAGQGEMNGILFFLFLEVESVSFWQYNATWLILILQTFLWAHLVGKAFYKTWYAVKDKKWTVHICLVKLLLRELFIHTSSVVGYIFQELM